MPSVLQPLAARKLDFPSDRGATSYRPLARRGSSSDRRATSYHRYWPSSVMVLSFKEAPPPPPPPTLLDRLTALQPKYQQDGCGASAYPFLAATIMFTLVMQCWERYLDLRQHKRIKERGDRVPPELERLVDAMPTTAGESSPAALLAKLKEKAPASRAYALDKSRFKFVSAAYSLAKALAFVLLGAMPYLWDAAEALGTKYFGEGHEIKVSLIFYGLWQLADTVVRRPSAAEEGLASGDQSPYSTGHSSLRSSTTSVSSDRTSRPDGPLNCTARVCKAACTSAVSSSSSVPKKGAPSSLANASLLATKKSSSTRG